MGHNLVAKGHGSESQECLGHEVVFSHIPWATQAMQVGDVD